MTRGHRELFVSDEGGKVVLPARTALTALSSQVPSRYGELGLRHPLGIYNTSVTRVAQRFARVIGLLSRPGHPGEELIESQESLLRALMEHMDDCINILRGLTSDSRGFEKDRHVKLYRRAIAEYRSHIGKVVARIKHRQGRLTLMAVQLEAGFFAGYFITVGLRGGAIGPDPDIHPNVTAFSFNRDLRFHLCHLLLTSARLAEAIVGLAGVAPVGSEPVDGDLARSIGGVIALPETYFPDEYRKEMPVLRFEAGQGGALRLVVEFRPGQMPLWLSGQNVQIRLTTRGDGATRAWKIPYSKPGQVF